MAFHNHLSHQDLSSLHHFAADQQQAPQPTQQQQHLPESSAASSVHHQLHAAAPSWLNTALLRSDAAAAAAAAASSNSFLNLHTSSDSAASSQPPSTPASAAAATGHHQWLSRQHSSLLQRNHSEVIDADSIIESADLKESVSKGDAGGGAAVESNWENAKNKAEILAHPLYEQLLSAHVACLRIATPVDQLPRIDAQLAQSQHVVAKYSAMSQGLVGDDKELDQFMTHYVLLLCSFKEQLQQHVRVHAMEAVMACWEIEQSLQSLTGVSPGEGTGATMSDDEDDQVDSDANLFDGSLDGTDSLGFGPLIPTETERSLMERVRQELKHELKQGYKEKIIDIREEILRKRRAGKLPGDTTSVLKSWWQSHSKWPYPTEEDKARLVQETGLQLKQINNWFINQRKRNWHSNPSTSTVLKSKRKR
ncbi:homeobox protein knotted-1-like 3 isoform X2 [Rhodamnia argentea]|uniref:Homeobox protein knotted-1-like 3 isoform X2 n=1 Tax=Rhodamnia argentea TaxID=178133 RepID=A0A8B8QPZ1_9MYRT|nr:homeobox protein knotted-1-like 3 isoform X3 [Rhodamnia argentea]XP_030548342.1 homeobox protein knotted-1-like 3 isoform X2 [Rhodamnia argentea]